MSFGLMSAARFWVTVLWSPPLVEIVWLSIGCPSTTNSGWLVPVSDALPRILIDALTRRARPTGCALRRSAP